MNKIQLPLLLILLAYCVSTKPMLRTAIRRCTTSTNKPSRLETFNKHMEPIALASAGGTAGMIGGFALTVMATNREELWKRGYFGGALLGSTLGGRRGVLVIAPLLVIGYNKEKIENKLDKILKAYNQSKDS